MDQTLQIYILNFLKNPVFTSLLLFQTTVWLEKRESFLGKYIEVKLWQEIISSNRKDKARGDWPAPREELGGTELQASGRTKKAQWVNVEFPLQNSLFEIFQTSRCQSIRDIEKKQCLTEIAKSPHTDHLYLNKDHQKMRK